MCGISGVVSEKDDIHNRQLLQIITDEIAHRGPDDAGEYWSSDGRVGLGHRRLAILDPRDRSSQPMKSRDGSYILSYNGELYNYKELRHQLERKKRDFQTDSDTEVILNAYIEWGIDAVNRFRGMYAFALYDNRRADLYLCRDRIGIKPLYFAPKVFGSKYLFCSEVDPLRQVLPKVNFNYSAVGRYLHYRFVGEDECIWEEIEKVKPGEWWRIDVETMDIKKTRYWDPVRIAKQYSGRRRKIHCDEARRKIKNTVRLHCRSDVPIGLLLSGGLDSSVIGYTAPSKSIAGGITVSFGNDGNLHSETTNAQIVASENGMAHETVSVAKGSLQSLAEDSQRICGEPLADSSVIPYLMLVRAVSDKYKVVIGGDGGDEAFNGYKWYWWDEILGPVPEFSPWVGQALAPVQQVRKGKRFLDYLNGTERTRYDVLRGAPFNYDEIKTLIPNAKLKPLPGFASSLPRNIRGRVYDLSTFTVSSILTKVDRLSMSLGLEVRVPFLDHQLIEWALTYDSRALGRWRHSKKPIRKCFSEEIPERVLTQPKTGFGAPLNRWGDNVIELAIQEIENGAIAGANVLSHCKVMKTLTAGPVTPQQAWTLLAFEYWLRSRV